VSGVCSALWLLKVTFLLLLSLHKENSTHALCAARLYPKLESKCPREKHTKVKPFNALVNFWNHCRLSLLNSYQLYVVFRTSWVEISAKIPAIPLTFFASNHPTSIIQCTINEIKASLNEPICIISYTKLRCPCVLVCVRRFGEDYISAAIKPGITREDIL
jgi:hypothetical protein